MRSALTRVVFRRLIRNQPIRHRDCIYKSPVPLSFRPSPGRCIPYTQTRTMFGFLRADDDAKYRTVVPGITVLIETNRQLEMRIRTSPKKDIAKAFNLFFQSRLDAKEMVTDFQAMYAHRVFRYLQETEEGEPPLLNQEDAKRALTALANTDYGRTWSNRPVKLEPSYVRLATDLFQSITGIDSPSTVDPTWILCLYRVLAFSGESEMAIQQVPLLPPNQITLEDWAIIFGGFMGSKSSESVARAAEIYKTQGNAVTPSFQSLVASTFARIGDLKSARQWISEVEDNDTWIGTVSATTILRACSKQGNQVLAKELVSKAMKQPDLVSSRDWWHEMLFWAAASGKTLNDIDQMMDVMARTNPGMEANAPTINELIKYANTVNSAVLIENFLKLAARRGIKPDSTTYLLKLDNQLNSEDLTDALSTYERLMVDLSELVSSEELAPRINKLIQAICASPNPDPEAIIDLVEEQNRRSQSLDPETVAALCINYLRADQYSAVVDLLRAHAPNFLISARNLVSNRLVDFCLDRRNTIDRVWDTYVILHKTFDEVDRDIRTRIMVEFLTRRRADMAVHVFNHMRAHYRPDTILTGETYVLALTGIGRTGDREALEIVHNLLKLDLRVDPDTQVYNALMLAYVGCDEARQALEYWHEMLASREGPDRKSVLIALWASENTPIVEDKATAVWQEMEKMKVEVDSELVRSYVGALAGNGKVEEAAAVVEMASEKYGVQPDVEILDALMHASVYPEDRVKASAWIQTHHPDFWKELTSPLMKCSPTRRRKQIQRTYSP